MPKADALTALQLRRIAKALADPRRFEILQEIGDRKKGILCADLREMHDVTAATLSHHLKELGDAGLITAERRGKFLELRLKHDVLNAYIEQLKQI